MFARHPLSSFRGQQCRVCVSITFRLVCLSTFVGESREDIQDILRAIVECLEDSDSHVRKAAIEGISNLAEQGMG